MAVLSVRCVILILVQGVLCLFESAQPIPDNVKSRYYELNAEKLRDFWHYAMLRGLIKVRARELLSFLPNIEKIVYWQCEKDAKSAVALAKCAVRVFDATENARRKEENSKLRKSGVITSFSARLSKPQPWIGTYGYSTQLKESEYSPYHIYSTKSRYHNPIRKQIRTEKLNSHKKKHISSPNEAMTTEQNVARIEEILERSTKSRIRRKLNSLKENVDTGSSINLQGIAVKYLRKML
ncbi:hypothetical protein NECAME_05672, partial [Necator americanus]